MWEHSRVVTTSAYGPWIVERADEGGSGAHEVSVDCGEVEERDASLGEKNETCVGRFKNRVR